MSSIYKMLRHQFAFLLWCHRWGLRSPKIWELRLSPLSWVAELGIRTQIFWLLVSRSVIPTLLILVSLVLQNSPRSWHSCMIWFSEARFSVIWGVSFCHGPLLNKGGKPRCLRDQEINKPHYKTIGRGEGWVKLERTCHVSTEKFYSMQMTVAFWSESETPGLPPFLRRQF